MPVDATAFAVLGMRALDEAGASRRRPTNSPWCFSRLLQLRDRQAGAARKGE
ncbi:hypothetical protein BRPE64_ACDS04030 [Caballeronia insecticola]|uniref:Uncharacterized protein n=1 Tax=Caballeronia insecticola TaxID=758793 RepID=R4WW54_9BURK|nr:hypothetical protein BRPE64_ACDS04030 [Caballeronia insecticola]